MKLFYSPGACSLAPHIVLRETRQNFEPVRVDLRSHTTEDGKNYYDINPKGAIPLLEIASGEYLSEGPIICQFIADKAKNTELMPAAGSMERYRVMEWQNYVAAELHKTFSPLFNPTFNAEGKDQLRGMLRKKYEYVNAKLGGKAYLTGDRFTAADAYLFVVSRWTKGVNVDLSGLDAVSAFMSRVGERPAVKAALDAESAKKA